MKKYIIIMVLLSLILGYYYKSQKEYNENVELAKIQLGILKK